MTHEFDPRLHQLLDQAAREFEPTANPRRLHRTLGMRARRRSPLVVPLAAAAALLLMVGTVSALVGTEDAAPRITPAEVPETTTAPSSTTSTTSSTTSSTTTTSTTTTSTTEPPTTEPPSTEPPSTVPLIAPPPAAAATATTSAPKPPPPPGTVPKDTVPKDTLPKDTVPKDTVPDTTKAPSIAFTAVQVWGTCAEDPPYDEFHGTAPAGEKVLVHWGSGSEYSYADASGSWYLKVYLSQVQVGQTIEVKVKSVGEVKYFSFTRTG